LAETAIIDERLCIIQEYFNAMAHRALSGVRAGTGKAVSSALRTLKRVKMISIYRFGEWRG
jgi:hypothetical protein